MISLGYFAIHDEISNVYLREKKWMKGTDGGRMQEIMVFIDRRMHFREIRNVI